MLNHFSEVMSTDGLRIAVLMVLLALLCARYFWKGAYG